MFPPRLRTRSYLVSRSMAPNAGLNSRKAHVEAPDGWIVTSAEAGGPIVSAEVPPAEPVKDNLVSFARAVRGVERYPITPTNS